MKIRQIALLILSFGLVWSINLAAASSDTPHPHKTVYDYSLVGFDGKETPLSIYKGKVLLIVNLASQSIYKSQIAALDALQKAYADQGLVLIGIPSGDFGSQEIKDNAALQRFYQDTEHLSFPVFSRASLRGKDAIPLVHLLTDPKDGTPGGDIHWNFTKFLIDREGQPVIRFEMDTDPADPEFRMQVEQVLNGTFKKPPPPAKESNTAADEDDDDGP